MYRIRGDTIPVLFDFVCFIGRTCFLNHTIRKKLGEMGDVQIHPMLPGDVILGAKNLANHLPLAMPASSPASWEWRAFAEGQNTSNHWQRCHKISSLQVKLFCYFYVLCLCGCSYFQAIRWLQISVTHGPRCPQGPHPQCRSVVSLASLHLSSVRRCIAQWKTFGECAAHRAFGHVLGGQLGGLEKLWKDIEGRIFFSSSLLIMFLLLHASTM